MKYPQSDEFLSRYLGNVLITINFYPKVVLQEQDILEMFQLQEIFILDQLL
jgi:hypothetical protein